MTSPILIDGAHVLRNGTFRPACVLIQGERIAAVAWDEEERRHLRERAGEIVRGEPFWLVPGLVDAHAHAYAGALRGSENGLPLELWALYTVLYGKALDAAALRAAILVGAAERLRRGVTALVDHSPQMHLAEAALAAHEQAGLRVGYAPFLHDLGDYDLMQLELPDSLADLRAPRPLDPAAYTAQFGEIVAASRSGSGRVTPLLGPNAPQRCSTRAWALWRDLRDRHDVPVHTHLLETRAQARLGHERWPGGTVAEMRRQDLLDGRLSVAHGIWLDPAEQEMLARHGVTVVHNPASNLMLGSGLLPFARYRDLGVRLALGTDSANTGGRHDLFEAMRLAFMLHRPAGSDPGQWPAGAEILAMATENGAHVLGLGEQLGSIEAGQLADLVFVHRTRADTALLSETADGFVLHAGSEAVGAVMIGGSWVMREGRILTFDEDAAMTLLHTVHQDIRTRIEGQREAVHEALPDLAAELHAFTAGPATPRTSD